MLLSFTHSLFNWLVAKVKIHDRVAEIFKASEANFCSLNHLHFLENCYFNSLTIINSQPQAVQLNFKENCFNLSIAAAIVVESKFIVIHS